MMQNVKINANQFLMLVIFFTIGTSILEVPSVLARKTNQDAWIAAIIGTIIGLFVIWVFTTIALWFPQLTYVQMNEKVFGKWFGKAVSLAFVIMALTFTASLLYESGIFLNMHLMPRTPMSVLNILMAGILIMGVYLGLETIARSAEIIGGFFSVILVLFIVLVLPDIQLETIKPVFETDSKTMVKSSFYYVFTSSVNAIVLLMIFPAFVSEASQAKRFFLLGNLIGGIIVIMITFLCVSVLGADKTTNEFYPSYELAKSISLGNFIERVEVLVALLWILSLYFKTTLYFYAVVFSIAQIFDFKDYRPFIMPLGMISVALSLFLFPNIIYQQRWNDTTQNSLSLVVGVFLPLLFVIVYGIRRKQLKNELKS